MLALLPYRKPVHTEGSWPGHPPFELWFLQCPVCAGPLAFEPERLVCRLGHSHEILTAGEQRFVDFFMGRDDPILANQRAVYDTPDSRYSREGSEDRAAFMENFVRTRVAGRVKAKDELLLRAMRELSLSPSSWALEVGCNDGRFLNTVTALHGCRGVGVDLSRTAVEQALQSRGSSFRSDFHVAEASALPFREGIFSAIVSFDVFEHLGHQAFVRTMRECHRVLQPGGTLVVYIVSQKDQFTLHETLRRVSGGRVGVDDREGHAFENFIHPDLFRTVAREAGFDVEVIRAYHGFWTLFAEEFLNNRPPRVVYRWLELLDLPLTRREHGNGFLAVARRS